MIKDIIRDGVGSLEKKRDSRPCFELERTKPEFNGVYREPDVYTLKNKGEGKAYGIIFTDISKNVEEEYYEGQVLYEREGIVVSVDEKIDFKINWYKWEKSDEKIITVDPETFAMMEFEKEHGARTEERICIKFYDKYDNQYEQIFKLNYLGSEYPKSIHYDYSAPKKIWL